MSRFFIGMGCTSRAVFTAGAMLIEADASLSADLPKTYGVDDFTMVIQDNTFDHPGRMSYTLTGELFEDGFIGDTLVVNGAIAPVMQTVPTGFVRLRILNACNARILTLSMTKGPLNVMASDGGLLASTVQTGRIIMSPGERYEVPVDRNGADSNSLMVAYEGDDETLFAGGKKEVAALEFVRNADPGFSGSMPDALSNLAAPDPSEATVTRSFELNMGEDEEQLALLAASWGNICGSGGMGIIGQPMNMERIDEEVRKGDTDIWRIRSDDQHHPFHIHGCSFRILSPQGDEPPAYEQGWKDMVHVEEEWSEVLFKFDHDAPAGAPYMYHCHILEHEDCGMMGQFTVS